MSDFLEDRFGLVFVLRRREALRPGDFDSKDINAKWGDLKPGSCEFTLRAKSLNEAYILLQELGLAPVPPDLRETYLASGGPFLSQVKDLVAKESGEFYTREPWQVTVTTSAGEQLTWALVKTAHSQLRPNLRDGQNVSREPLKDLLASHQLAKEFSRRHSAIGDVIKTRKKKKTTDAKRLLLQDPKLFKVCGSRGGNGVKGGKHPGTESLDQGATIGNQLGQEESKEEKRKRKLARKQEKEEARKKRKAEKEGQQKAVQETDVGVEGKRGNKKYGHLQAFVEKRRRKRQKREVREERSEEEKGEEKSLLDLNAQVFTHF